MGANNNKGGEFVKKTDMPVVIVNGNNNKVKVKVTSEASSKTLFAIAIVLFLIALAVLAVLFCCPELLPDFVRWIISVAIGS